MQYHWSEFVTFPRPDYSTVDVENAAQTSCPYSGSYLTDWDNPSAWVGNAVPTPNGKPARIAPYTFVLVRGATLNMSAGVYGIIIIPASSSLVFDDSNMTLHTMGIAVYGALLMGCPTCRLRSYINIVLHGSAPVSMDAQVPYLKGIYVTGSLGMHSVVYAPTWTRLAATAHKGDTLLYLQDVVNWEVGQTIVVTTTALKDFLDWTQNEVCNITAVWTAPHLGAAISVVQISSPLHYEHYGDTEYQAEVALLSRRITVSGSTDDSEPASYSNPNHTFSCTDPFNSVSTYPCNIDNGYGGHIMVATTGQGRATAVELLRMGKSAFIIRTVPYYLLYFYVHDCL